MSFILACVSDFRFSISNVPKPQGFMRTLPKHFILSFCLEVYATIFYAKIFGPMKKRKTNYSIPYRFQRRICFAKQ